MRNTDFRNFIRSGGTKTFSLKLSGLDGIQTKQDVPSKQDAVRELVESAWSGSFTATTRAILRAGPYEFSASGLSLLDMETLRAEVVRDVLAAVNREGLDLTGEEGRRRALTVMSGTLNQAQQQAMNIAFYVWTTQHDARVRGSHADRDGKIFRWDSPPEGGHPTQDYGCRCYALALGTEGYWDRVKESVDAFTADIGQWEGNVAHMYLDTTGNVTVGKGQRLRNVASATALPFRQRDSGALASTEEIGAEYDLIAGMTPSPNHGAEYYEQFTALDLPQDQIDRLVRDHVRGDFKAMLKRFPGFGNFPLSVQTGLWDMIYNLGPTGLSAFRNFRSAVLDGNWATAAQESERGDVSDARNRYVFDLFMDAADAEN
jgi:SPP1 gp7 family putative phage head morphogenesis protein